MVHQLKISVLTHTQSPQFFSTSPLTSLGLAEREKVAAAAIGPLARLLPWPGPAADSSRGLASKLLLVLDVLKERVSPSDAG